MLRFLLSIPLLFVGLLSFSQINSDQCSFTNKNKKVVPLYGQICKTTDKTNADIKVFIASKSDRHTSDISVCFVNYKYDANDCGLFFITSESSKPKYYFTKTRSEADIVFFLNDKRNTGIHRR